MRSLTGITGVVGSQDEEVVKGMLQKINHRGKKQTVFSDKNLVVGICRHESADAPFFEKSGILCGVDGTAKPEELAMALRNKCLRNIPGSFAGFFAGERFILFRDHFGVKPMYFALSEGKLYFGSEIKCFQGLDAERVEFVKPGEIILWENGKIQRERYYVLRTGEKKISAEECISGILRLLNEGVAYNLSEDTGALLSAGLDSAAIVFLASKRIKKLNTFVAAFEAGSEDALLSEKLASELGLEHTVVEYGLKEMLDVLPEVIYHLESFDFALVRSAIPNYIVVREAAKHVRTLLSGEGGDELFAGYSYLENIPGNLNSELRKLLHTAHNNAFQRDDRMFAAHGVDCRVPFLHLPLVEFAFGIPSEYKIQNGVRKWILRRAIEKAGLPDYIVNREKRKFSDGAGSMFAIEEYVENQISDREFEIARKELRFVRNKEELFYYRIFCSHFDGMEHLVGITERPER